MMLSREHTVARFLPNQEFHVGREANVSAPRTAGCYRIGCGQLFQVLGCVLISVVFGPAAWTCPTPCTQRQHIKDVPTDRASLTRWEPSIDHNDVAPGKRRLVPEMTSNLGQTSIHNRSRQAGADHAIDCQVFDSYPAEVFDETCRELVGHVVSDVGDVFVQTSELGLGFPPILPVLGTSGQFFVESSEFDFVLTHNSGCFDSRAVGQNSKIDESKIDTYHGLGFAMVGIDPAGLVDFDRNRYAPMTSVFGESRRKNSTWEPEGLSQSNPSELWDAKSLTVEDHSTRLDAECGSRFVLLFELRVAWLLAVFDSTEKVGEGCSKVGYGTIEDIPWKLVHPSKVCRFECVQLGIEFLPGGLFSCGILSLPLGKAPVESKTCRASATREPRSLSVVQVESDAMCQDGHGLSFSTIRSRMTCEMEQCRRLASTSNQFLSGVSRWIVTGIRFMPLWYRRYDGVVNDY